MGVDVLTSEGGSCEHIRPFLLEDDAETYTLDANQLWWITDRTPHESLPLKEGAYRQFFRYRCELFLDSMFVSHHSLVIGPIGVWYSQHSTPNPLCSLPINVVTINSNKFTGK